GADVELLERLLVDHPAEGAGGGPGTAAGHDRDDVEGLRGGDDPGDGQEERDRAQQRQGEVAEELPSVGAVERRRLVDVPGEVEDRGVADDGHEAEPLPGVGDGDPTATSPRWWS